MNSNEHEDEEEDFSPSALIQLFERVAFERGHDVHDQVASMVQYWSSAQVDRSLNALPLRLSLLQITLDLLDAFIDCIKMIFLQPYLHQNPRINDFVISLTHVMNLSYNSNKNLALVFETLVDLYSQVSELIGARRRW